MLGFKLYHEEVKFKDYRECARVRDIAQVMDILTDCFDILYYRFKEKSVMLYSYN